LLLGCHALLPLSPPGADSGRDISVNDGPPSSADGSTADAAVTDASHLSDLLPPGVVIQTYGKKTLTAGDTSSHFPDIWDLTDCQVGRQAFGCDLELNYTVDLSGVTAAKQDEEIWITVGIREEGEPDFTPNNKGGWMVSFAVNLDSDPTKLDKNDRHTAQSVVDVGENDYDVHDCNNPTIGTPVKQSSPSGSFGFWFDRDGADAAHTAHPLAGDGTTYNTKGLYKITLCYRATGNTSGTLCHRVNGVSPGFYTKSPSNQVPDIYPAGVSFAGQMHDMQVFVGFAVMPGGKGTVVLDNFEVKGCTRKK